MPNLGSRNNRLILMNPGPVNVSERVRRALLKPDICHRETEFTELLGQVRKKILMLLGVPATHTVALFSGSGTTALEAMLVSFAQSQKKILVLSNGVYGERIKNILEIYNTPVYTLSSSLGYFPSLEKIEGLLKKDASIHAIAMVHHETSTGMLNPLESVGKLAKKYKKTFLVDAISSLGAEKIDFKKYSIDACAGTSGKCLHGFPGVSFVVVSKKAVQQLKGMKPRSLVLDLLNTLKHEENNDTPFTPAVQIFYALNEALDELVEEGLQNRIKNYVSKNALLEKGFMDLKLNFLVEKKWRSHVLTALWLPPSLSYEKLHEALKTQGFVIYAGQSELKNKIFRVANLGNITIKDLRNFLQILRQIIHVP